VTSHDHPEYIEAAKAVGADHFIPKDKCNGLQSKHTGPANSAFFGPN
jgi:hypothetical protein